MLKTYNGFDHYQRMAALRWLKREYAAGRRTPPVKCDACGQTDGLIQAHSEDYSVPHANHTGFYGVCYRCHMMIHNRFKNHKAWETYKRQIRSGLIFYPITSFNVFCGETLRAMGRNIACRQVEPHITFLDKLSDSEQGELPF
jgi:hypothetical protein